MISPAHHQNNDVVAASPKGSRRGEGRRISYGRELEKVVNPRRKPRNSETMSAADLCFGKTSDSNDSRDTFDFADDSDWVTDLDESESESEKVPGHSALSIALPVAKPEIQKIKPDTQKIGGSESDWFSEFSESEAEFADARPVRSLLEKKKKTKRTAGQAKREADAHGEANSPETHKENVTLKKKTKASKSKPVKSSKHSRGSASNRDGEVEDEVHERTASPSERISPSVSVKRRSKETPKGSKESAKRSSNHSSGDRQVEHILPSVPSLDDSIAPRKTESTLTSNTRGRVSNRGDERTASPSERSSRSVSVKRRPKETPKSSKEKAKRSSNHSSEDKQVEHMLPSVPSLDDSIAPRKSESTLTSNTRGRVSNRGDERTASPSERSSRSVSVKRRPKETPKSSKESAKRSSNHSSGDKQVENILPSVPLLDDPRKTESTPNTRGRGRASNRGGEVEDQVHERSSRSVSVKRRPKNNSGRQKSYTEMGIPSQIDIVDSDDDTDTLIEEAKEKERKSIVDKSRKTPFCDRSLSVSRHGVRDRSRSRSVSRNGDAKGRNVADIPLMDDRERAKRGESGSSYLPTALDRRKEQSQDDGPRSIKNGSDSMIKNASGRMSTDPTDGQDVAKSNSRPSLDGHLGTSNSRNGLSSSASLSGIGMRKVISDSASLGGDMRASLPSRGGDKSKMLQVDSHNWSGAMDNLLQSRRQQRPSTMESPCVQKPKLGLSAGNRRSSLVGPLDVDALYSGIPEWGDKGDKATHSPPARSRFGGITASMGGLTSSINGLSSSMSGSSMHASLDPSPSPRNLSQRLGTVMSSVKGTSQKALSVGSQLTGVALTSKYGNVPLDGKHKAGSSQPSPRPSPKPNSRRKSTVPVGYGKDADADRRHPGALGAPPLHHSP